jgi:protein MpaA
MGLDKRVKAPQNETMFSDPNWATTAAGTPVALFSSHTLLEQGKPLQPILLIGGVHGDEPEGVSLAQSTLQALEQWHKSNIELAPWVVIPILNVDGFTRRTRVNGRGVDLNRNYPASDWSPVAKAPRYHPGPGPGSEPEIQSLCELIQRVRPRLIIHCHSWQPCIVATGERAQKDGARLARTSGYRLEQAIGYDTPGSLSRYGWHDHGIPVICIEEQEGLSDLSTIWPRFETAMREVFVDTDFR